MAIFVRSDVLIVAVLYEHDQLRRQVEQTQNGAQSAGIVKQNK